MIKDEIKNLIERAVSSLYDISCGRSKDAISVLVEKPKEISHGDYSTNVALVVAKKLGKNPIEIANKITSEIRTSLIRANKGIGQSSLFEKVEVAPPGFVNFYLSKEFFVNNVKEILKEKNKFRSGKNLKSKKIIIEYTDPNILKEFHIGHLMPNTIGESLARIFEFLGAKVKRVNYQGDVGLHVAKAIWAMKQGVTLLEAYPFGHKAYEENETSRKEIIQMNKVIFDRSDKTINKLYDQGKKESLAYFEEIYKKLGTKFDHYFFESEVANIGKKIVEEGLKKGIFEKGERGAIVFRGEKYGLHARVFINSEGLPTYEAKELGLAKIKYDKYKYNNSIIVTANEQNEYFKVVLSVMSQIFPDLAQKTKHIGHGMMRLPEGKMSSRTGKVVTFEFLLNEIEQLVKEKIKDRNFLEDEKNEVAEKVAIGAVKYSILKQSIGSDIIYDFEKSISFDGDSGPYLQYSLTRALSVLRKAKAVKIKPSLKKSPAEIGDLERLIHYFSEVVEKAGKDYEPHHLVLYLTELASSFNAYYAKEKIVDKNDKFSPYKIALTQVFSVIMKNGLWLLGIPAPERM